jgi:hypothetical protein
MSAPIVSTMDDDVKVDRIAKAAGWSGMSLFFVLIPSLMMAFSQH